MRKIIFRGKSKESKKHEWYFGGYVAFNCISTIDGEVIVYPETVGQYTGLTDVNGKQIFEGDIVKTHYANAVKADFVEQVVFNNGKFCGMYKLKGGGRMYAPLADGVPHDPRDFSVYMDRAEVIGNIHDNPELVKI